MARLDYSVPSSVRQYTVTTETDGLITGNIYSFLVIAVNYVGDSPVSDTLANIVAGTPPSAPLNLCRADGVNPEGTKITLVWETPSSDGGSPLLSYTLYWN